MNRRDIEVRTAGPRDNAGLVALATKCPMEGDIGLCVERAPDFFALNRLEGKRWRLGVVVGEMGEVRGCIAVAERFVFLHGRATRTMYVSDLKVDPAFRGQGVGDPSPGVADALVRWARETCRAWGGNDVPVFLTVLAGNRAMARRLAGPRGLPRLDVVGTLQSHSIPILGKKRLPLSAFRIARGEAGDVEEMAALWNRVAQNRQFAPALSARSFADWIEAAPALNPSSYLLARNATGELLGFLAIWNQHEFKQLRIARYSPRLRAVRLAYNALGPLFGAPRLPPRGDALPHANAVHVCIPGDAPEILQALLVEGYVKLRERQCAFLNIGLDRRDPLTKALGGLLAQKTAVWTAVTTPSGGYRGAPLNTAPVHHEIALV